MALSTVTRPTSSSLRPQTDVTVRIGGSAGDGVQSAGEMLARLLSRSGLHVSTYNGNQSLIRGGVVWFHLHAAPWKVSSLGFGIDFLVPLTQSFFDEHVEMLNEGGNVLYDPSIVRPSDSKAKTFSVPMSEIALQHDKRPIMRNVAAVAATAAALGVDRAVLAETIQRHFARSEKMSDNITVGNDAHSDFTRRFGVVRRLAFDYSAGMHLMNANQTLALGAVAAGCRYYAAYPMSPASGILHWLASHAKELGVTVFLAEDEISAVTSTIGASFAGARAMCGTSGGGFALMQEAIGLASMTETPLVVVDVMRAGPSTGLPTKTSQGDLNMVLGIAQDDFPRVILAPRSSEEAFYTAGKAFNLADEFQVPVIILSDFAISDGGYSTVGALNFEVPILRGKIAQQFDRSATNGTWFKRFELTPDGVSSRSFPGSDGMMFVAKSDEHDEYGHDLSDVLSGLKKSVAMREKMHEKRMRKLDQIRRSAAPPEFFGPDGADLTIVTWGSSAGPVREGIRRLNESGGRVNSLEFSDIYPLNAPETERRLGSCNGLLNVESNYTGQFSRYLRSETGVSITKQFLKYNGEPIYPIEVVKAAEKALEES